MSLADQVNEACRLDTTLPMDSPSGVRMKRGNMPTHEMMPDEEEDGDANLGSSSPQQKLGDIAPDGNDGHLFLTTQKVKEFSTVGARNMDSSALLSGMAGPRVDLVNQVNVHLQSQGEGVSYQTEMTADKVMAGPNVLGQREHRQQPPHQRMFETVEKNIFELSSKVLPLESATSAVTYDT